MARLLFRWSIERGAAPRWAVSLGVVALPFALAVPALAQSGPVVIGGSSPSPIRVMTDPSGAVSVDWGVIDSIGSRSASGSVAGGNGPIVLAPPKSQPRPRVTAHRLDLLLANDHGPRLAISSAGRALLGRGGASPRRCARRVQPAPRPVGGSALPSRTHPTRGRGGPAPALRDRDLQGRPPRWQRR